MSGPLKEWRKLPPSTLCSHRVQSCFQSLWVLNSIAGWRTKKLWQVRKTEPELRLQPGLVTTAMPGHDSGPSPATPPTSSQIQGDSPSCCWVAAYQGRAGGCTLDVFVLFLLCFSNWEIYLLFFFGFYLLLLTSPLISKFPILDDLFDFSVCFIYDMYHTFIAFFQYNYKTFGILYNKLKTLACLFRTHSNVTCHVVEIPLQMWMSTLVKLLGSKTL